MSTILSPVALPAVNVPNSSVQVAPSNPSRLGLYVFNPNASINLWIAPGAVAAAVNGAGSIFLAAKTGLVLTPQTFAQFTQSLNAIAESGPTNAITVWEVYP